MPKCQMWRIDLTGRYKIILYANTMSKMQTPYPVCKGED